MTTATPPATSDPAAVACSTCQRPAAQWCRTAAGAYTTPHAARLKLAAATPVVQPPASTGTYDGAVFDQGVYGNGPAPA